MKKLLLTLFLIAGWCFTAMGVPADPTPITVTQPDGTTLTVRLRGDEFFHFYETLDGVPLVRNAAGAYYYARLQDKQLASTGMLAHQASWRTSQEKVMANSAIGIRQQFNTIAKEARNEHFSAMESMPQKAISRTGKMYNWKGKKTGLVILVQFSDLKFRSNHTQEVFDRMFNEAGFDFEDAKGSVYDYYCAQSKNQFELNMDVVGPVTMPKELAYYGGNSNGSKSAHVQEMVEEAFRQADQYADFSKYDWDNNGYVDNVFVVYAGYDESYSGNSEDYIWAHQWATNQPVLCDGVYAQQYACASEMFGWEQMGDTKLCGIGTACHEMGHTLGLSDLYDVDYSGANHPESWSLMSGGGHLSNGQIPSNLTAYERVQLGWLELKELTEDTTVTNMQSLSSDQEAYVIYNPAYRSEFFVLENRQKTGFDSAQGGHGLMVFHIDFDKTVWDWNQPNDDIDHPRYVHIPAGGDYQNAASSPFPGTAKVTELTDYSHPAATLYNPNMDGEYKMHCSIEKITENNGLISFTFSKDTKFELPKVYNIGTTSRGNWAVDAEGVRFMSSKDAGIDATGDGATSAQMQFVLSEQQDATYLYSVSAQKFVNPDYSLSLEPKHPITLEEQTDGTKIIAFDSEHYININESGKLEIGTSNTPDAGNKVTISEAPSDVFTAWTAERGGWAVNANGTRLVSSSEAGLGTMVNAFRTQLQFRLVNIDGSTYLYSVHAHKFVNSTCTLSSTPRNPVSITKLDNGTNVVRFDETHYINIGGDNQITVSGWSTPDDGNMMTFESVPLEMTLSTVHWTYLLNEKPYKEFDNYLERNLNVKGFSPDFYKVLSQSAESVGTDTKISIEVNGEEALPFPKETWMLQRSGDRLMRIGNSDTATPCDNINDWKAVKDNDNLWNISGSLDEGFELRHKGTNATLAYNNKKWELVKGISNEEGESYSLKAENDGKYMAYNAEENRVYYTDVPDDYTSFTYQPVGYASNMFLKACNRIPEGAVGKPEIIDEESTQQEIVEALSLLMEEENMDNLDKACEYSDLCDRIANSKRIEKTNGLYYLVVDIQDKFGALTTNNGDFNWTLWDKNVNQVLRIDATQTAENAYTVFTPNNASYLTTATGQGGSLPETVEISPVNDNNDAYLYARHFVSVNGEDVLAGSISDGKGGLSTVNDGDVAGYWYLIPAKTMCIAEKVCSSSSVDYVTPCLPFAVKVPANCQTETLYAAAIDAEATSVVLSAVDCIPAQTGFICSKKESENGDSNFTFEIVDAEVSPIETCLKGSLQEISSEEFTGAILASVRGKLGFSHKTNIALPANTAYLESESSFIPVVLPTDGIQNIIIDTVSDNDVIYDLSGRRIQNPQTGRLYIKNGRKYIHTLKAE